MNCNAPHWADDYLGAYFLEPMFLLNSFLLESPTCIYLRKLDAF